MPSKICERQKFFYWATTVKFKWYLKANVNIVNPFECSVLADIIILPRIGSILHVKDYLILLHIRLIIVIFEIWDVSLVCISV